MRYARLAVLACTCAIASSWIASAAPAPAPKLPLVEAFGTLPELSEPTLSPDGKHLAAIDVYQGRPVARIQSIEDPAARPLIIPYTDGFIIGVQWANNDRLLITIDKNKKSWFEDVKPLFRTISVDRNGGRGVLLLNNVLAANSSPVAAIIADLAPGDPDHVYMPFDLPFSGYGVLPPVALYRVDVVTGAGVPVLTGTSDTIEWIMDGDGHVVGRIDETTNPLVDHLLLYLGGTKWREVTKTDASDGRGLSVEGVTDDRKELVLDAVSDTADTAGLMATRIETGKNRDLFFNPKYDIGETLKDPWTGRVVGVAYTVDSDTIQYFDPGLQAMQRGLQAAFPGLVARAVSWDQSRMKVVVQASASQQPPAYYLLDRTTHQANLISAAYPKLTAADLGPTKPYPYKARDGLDIPAYLTLPPGKEPKDLPAVIMPHGGPMARDKIDFDWMAQFLANRGYVVLQPNFRGSSGYGTKFLEAGFGQWGLKMQDDVTDGVNKLIADGIVDPKRICIVGSSYGGYAALAGAAFTPDLYACAAGWAGVYDLRRFLATRADDFGKDSAMISSWSHFIGDRTNDAAKLDAASPAVNAGKIKCPILLMHGAADVTVRINQSELMERALNRARKKVTFVEIKDETHYMQTSTTRIRWLTELEKFLKENIGN
jgi:dipeptidyl aminopeptidase/acylaminoacyl peptidase